MEQAPLLNASVLTGLAWRARAMPRWRREALHQPIVTEAVDAAMMLGEGKLARLDGYPAIPEPASWATALREGIRRIQQYGGASEGDRTMLDALIPAVSSLEAGEGFAGAAAAAKRGAERTSTIKSARAGRSSYVPEDVLRGVPDPGAVAFEAIFDALART